MNWFTSESVKFKPKEEKQKLVNEHDSCEHVTADPSLLVKVQYENDSFGREGYCLCQECLDQCLKEEAESTVCCYDCKGTFKKSETTEWRWYDFYAPAGEEPLIICNTCRAADTHLRRCDQDHANYTAECGSHDDEDYDPDWDR